MKLLIERFVGRDLRNKKTFHYRLTPIYLDGSTYRLGVRFMPSATDPVVERRLKRQWGEMIERSDD